MFDWPMNVHFIFITSLRVSALQVEKSRVSWRVGGSWRIPQGELTCVGALSMVLITPSYLASHGAAETLRSLHFFVVIKLNQFDLM